MTLVRFLRRIALASVLLPALESDRDDHAVACHFWREIAAAGSQRIAVRPRPVGARLARLQSAFAAPVA